VNRAIMPDDPPPYEPSKPSGPASSGSSDAQPESSSATPRPPFGRGRTSSSFQPADVQRVNHISLFSKHTPISGTFLVDPLIPVTPLATSFSSISQRKIEKRERSVERQHAKNMNTNSGRWFSRGRTPEVNAAFRTRHAAINLELAVVGSTTFEMQGPAHKMRARIMASSRHGKIMVNLFDLHDSRCVDLDISTRHGNIIVMLPQTFNGTICLRQRHGGTHFLPAFAARKSLVRATDREALLVLGGGEGTVQGDGIDRCVIGSRGGRVTIGISGLDVYEGPVGAGGLFKLIGDAVQAGAKVLEEKLTKL